MLEIGSRLPDFETTTTLGRTLGAAELAGSPVVVFFYPKAFTPGCKREVRAFVEHFDAFRSLGARIIGVSMDDHSRQCEFAEDLGVEFALVADADGVMTSLFGVERAFLQAAKRVTFVFDEEGILEAVFPMELRFAAHAESSLRHLRERAAA
jgi:peroxiredoxin Q/BCP